MVLSRSKKCEKFADGRTGGRGTKSDLKSSHEPLGELKHTQKPQPK